MEVEKLFQTSSIAAVREVETKTRHEIEEKKKQLRAEIGESYRDLISSADTIIDISLSCHRLVELTGSLQSGLGLLAGGVERRGGGGANGSSAGGGDPDPPAVSSYDRLYALGSRIKYLIDTPETIYGCLDGREHLAAARRYVRAAEVHRLLTAGQAKQVAQRFPLLQHQWPLVKKFRPQVFAAAGDWLAGHGELGAAEAAAALAAQALLKPMDGAELLKAFLTARQSYLLNCLSAAAGADADTDLDSLACILADVATMVCATLAQCGELFLQLPGVSTTPLLVAALAGEDGSSADLLFDTGKEADAWKSGLEAVKGRLAELSAAGLALECSQWLDQLSQQMRQLGGRLLGPCGSGQGLLAVEAAVRAALEEWRYELQAGSSGSAAAVGAAGAAGQEEAAAVHLSWADVCQWVLGRPAPLWPLLFEQPLLERAKQLVGQDFSGVVDEVAALLGQALEAAAGLPPSAPGAYQAASWADMVDLEPATPDAAPAGPAGSSKRRRLAGQPRPGSAAAAAAGQPGGGSAQLQSWLPQAELVVARFDQQLGAALSAALDACGGGQQRGGAADGSGAAAAAAAARRVPGHAETAASRALVLEPFVQDRCAEAAEGIAASLDARVLALPAQQYSSGTDAAAVAAYAPTATQALILGRVALGLAGRSSMLPLVLGPPDQWRAAARGGGSGSDGVEAGGRPALLGPRLSSGGAAAPTVAPPGARYDQLQQRLHSVGLRAYGVWAQWASAGLAGELAAGLQADSTLEAAVPLRSWEETVIGGGGEGGADGEPADAAALLDAAAAGGGGVEMRFALPAAPSPAAVRLALAACQEVDRAGGHLLEGEALALVKWQLGGAVLSTLSALLAEQDHSGGNGSDGSNAAAAAAAAAGSGPLAARLSEKGVLQLLFDARFMLDLLAPGARPASTGPADAAGGAAALATRRRETAALEALLSRRLDPIDWATYEPYLYTNKERSAARCQVLFGMLQREAARPAGGGAAASVAGGMSSDSNILRMAPVGPRFSYLPVTTPVALLRQSSAHQLARAASGARGDLPQLAPGLGLAGAGGEAAPGAGGELSAATYSFASLLSGSGKPAARQDGAGSEAAAAAAASSAAGGVGSGVGKLMGSLFGGQAAEALGDVSGAGAGLLSSLARFNK